MIDFRRLVSVFCVLLFVASPHVFAQVQQEVESWGTYNGYSRKLWDDVTELRSWSAAELPGSADRKVQVAAALRDPHTYELTGEHNPPADAFRMSPGMSFELDFGELPISCYVFRPIALVKSKDIVQYRKPLYLQLRVTGPNGFDESYLHRVPYWDKFFSLTELFFNADVPGHYRGELSVTDESAVDLYIHNVELHDALRGLSGEPVKKSASLHTSAERDYQRSSADPEAVMKPVKQWVRVIDPIILDHTAAPLPADQRAQRDKQLWDAFPPINAMSMAISPTGGPSREVDRPHRDDIKEFTAEHGHWEYENDWRKWWVPLTLINRKTGERYTKEDLLAHKALPKYPYVDRGAGAYTPPSEGESHGQTYAPVPYLVSLRWRAVMAAVAADDGDDIYNHLPMLYHALGNRRAARDAALILVKWAHIYPAYTQAITIEDGCIMPAGLYNRDIRLTRRLLDVGHRNLQQGLAVSYDLLFDFIKGNDELARAVHEFIPWVKTEQDVRRLIETRVLQYGARQSMYFNIYSDHNSHTYLMNTALIQQDPQVTRPWMDFLWEKTWLYPHPRAGLPDYLSTTTQRDGSTEIGSVFYSLRGSSFSQIAWMSKRYIANGGDPKFDLTDPKLYGKVHDAATFALDASVAGGFPMSIGDVGGPVRRRLVDTNFISFGETFRRGYSISSNPRLAWMLINYFGRAGEDDATWATMQQQADALGRNPLLISRPRVLTNWAGILEHGHATDDFRLKTAAMVRIGTGHGHAHNDTLDLQLMAHGVRGMNDIGWRGSYSSPSPKFTQLHNLVEINEGQWQGHAWISQFAPGEGLSYLRAETKPAYTQREVSFRNRSVALIDVNPGREGVLPPAPLPYTNKTKFDPEYTPSKRYVFDVERVSGGSLHTWCFHGTVSDQFNVNMTNGGAASLTDDERTYLRRYLVDDVYRYGGDAPPVVIADWRLRRDAETIEATNRDDKKLTLHQRQGEADMLDGSYNPDAPRIHTRVHLADSGVDRLLVGYYTPQVEQEQTTWPFLFGQRRGENLESAFPAIIESYVGDPFIKEVKPLIVAGNEKDARRAVAVKVTTVDGRTDLCFSDGRSKPRRIGGVTVTGSFAFVSQDAMGLCEMMLVDGTRLATPMGRLNLPRAAGEGAVARVDYMNRKAWLTGKWSDMELVGEQIELGNDEHQTSFTIVAAERDGIHTVVTLDKAIDLSYAHVISVDVPARKIKVNVSSMSSNHLGMNAGLTLTNDDQSKAYRVTMTQERTYQFEKLTTSDFKVDDVVRVWEFGVGDKARVAMRARVTRGMDGKFVLQSNGPAKWTPSP